MKVNAFDWRVLVVTLSTMFYALNEIFGYDRMCNSCANHLHICSVGRLKCGTFENLFHSHSLPLSIGQSIMLVLELVSIVPIFVTNILVYLLILILSIAFITAEIAV